MRIWFSIYKDEVENTKEDIKSGKRCKKICNIIWWFLNVQHNLEEGAPQDNKSKILSSP